MEWIVRVVPMISTPKYHASLIHSYMHCKTEITLNNPMNVDHDNSL